MGKSGAVYTPPSEYQQAQQSSYGYQYRQERGRREQRYGPVMQDPRNGGIVQPYFEYSTCKFKSPWSALGADEIGRGRRKALLVGSTSIVPADLRLESTILAQATSWRDVSTTFTKSIDSSAVRSSFIPLQRIMIPTDVDRTFRIRPLRHHRLDRRFF